MRLPRRIALPFGYVVTVREVTDSEMLSAQDEDDQVEVGDGLWDVSTRTILIRKSLPVRRKRYVLGHEVLHCVADWQHACLNEEVARP